MKPIYFNPQQGYPVSHKLFYRCKSCGVLLASQPVDCVGCSCGNIFIDVDCARISVKVETDVELLESEQ